MERIKLVGGGTDEDISLCEPMLEASLRPGWMWWIS
jgi:hypothetical protein